MCVSLRFVAPTATCFEYHCLSIDEWSGLTWQLPMNIILTVEKCMKTLLIQTAVAAVLASLRSKCMG
jgi:hypothetical protein